LELSSQLFEEMLNELVRSREEPRVEVHNVDLVAKLLGH